MTRVHWIAFVGCLVWALAAPAEAVDVNGIYQLSVVDVVDHCTYAGQLVVSQSGSSFSGSVSMMLVNGPGCPSSLSGSASGTLMGNTISFGVASGSFGVVTFGGTVSPDGGTMSGNWITGSVPEGTWAAVRLRRSEAPTMSAWCLGGLAVLLAWAGMRRVRRV